MFISVDYGHCLHIEELDIYTCTHLHTWNKI